MVALRLRLQNQIVVPFQGAGDCAAESNFFAGQILSGGVVDIAARNRERTGGVPLVDLRLHAIGITDPVIVKIMGNKLIRARIGSHNISLPCEKIRYKLPLEFLIGLSQTGVDGAAHVGKILPRINAVAPVIQSPRLI